ncbi:MAG: hypothetical protein KDC37_01025 [Flavobacteriales bacterium]|nr:hypothetical protein [Flavobacteriales bacterium]
MHASTTHDIVQSISAVCEGLWFVKKSVKPDEKSPRNSTRHHTIKRTPYYPKTHLLNRQFVDEM